ncbi:hypothetical protein [Clostridium sp. UBA2485]|uniref:hypothetical protein n=1 Tax=Clostridium sp. UBA2485 TaxID=1946352 RepID=UPI0025BE2A7F|nr:hypothetical protein [Clostridium sp. UBA2485]
MSYLIADKGIERRIEKHLFKRLGLKSKVEYTLSSSIHRFLDRELRIKLYEYTMLPKLNWTFNVDNLD